MINLQHWSLSLSCVIPFILPRSRRPIQCHADQSPKGVILGSGHCFGVGMEQFLRNLQPGQDCPVIRGFPLVVKSFDRDEWMAQIAPEATEKEAETLEVCYNDAKFAQDEGMMVNQTEMDRFVTPPPPLILASLVLGLGRIRTMGDVARAQVYDTESTEGGRYNTFPVMGCDLEHEQSATDSSPQILVTLVRGLVVSPGFVVEMAIRGHWMGSSRGV